MKKLFSVMLSIVFFLVSGLFNILFAQTPNSEKINVASLGTAYSSSEKNSLWTPAKTINDGVHGSKTWEGWECAYPKVEKGQDTSKGFGSEYCGIIFGSNFYEISRIKISLGLHTLLGGQNMKYELIALIDGKWQQVVTFMDSDTTPYDEKYKSYYDVMGDENAEQRVLADYCVELNSPVTTNNIRLCVSEFGKNYEGGDVKVFPYIYELELYGKKTEAPEIILPEGATATTNIAWYSYPYASSSQDNHYPYLAIDENDRTYWTPDVADSTPTYTIEFDKEYTISKIAVDLNDARSLLNASVGIRVDGDWLELSVQPNDDLEYMLNPIKATGVRISFKMSDNIQLIALEAHLSESKTYYLDNRFSASQIESASKGNISIIGKPYASSSLTPYSDINCINDGSKNDKQWFTGTVDVPAYCGMTFDYPQRISRAVITVKSMYVYGVEAMSFEIQALINGNYVKVAEGKSYNEKTGYTTEYAFDEIETTDVRVVITKMGGAVPNVAELELFDNDNKVIPMFDGLEPIIWENCTGPDENPIVNEHVCEKSNYDIFIYVAIGAIAVIATVGLIALFKIMKKKNKEV